MRDEIQNDVDGLGPETRLDRRALLRRGGAVLAGAAGVAALTADRASAATGDPVVLGATNDAQATATTITSSTASATLALANSASGAAANVVPVSSAFDIDVYVGATQSGDLVNHTGSLLFTHDPSRVGEVYTDAWASQLVPINPRRMLDTRTAAGRDHVLNRAGAFDSAGRLLAGHTISLDLSDLVFDGVAVYANLTIVQPLKAGYATLWPSGTRPGISSINYAAGQIVANFAVCGLSSIDSVEIFTQQTTHVLLDVTGFAVGGLWQVNPGVRPATAAATLAPGGTTTRKPPSWAHR